MAQQQSTPGVRDHGDPKLCRDSTPDAGGASSLIRTSLDLTWLDQLNGQHEQAFDYGSFDLSADARPQHIPQRWGCEDHTP
jgi:hypothetical protein